MGYLIDSSGHYELDSNGQPIRDSLALTTPGILIKRVLKKSGVLGVGQTASADDTQDAFDDLNDMIGQWARKRWLIYHLRDEPLVSAGAQFYTIGPGGDFNIPRPDRLEAAFMRQLYMSPSLQTDFPLTVLEAREDYNRVRLKTLTAFSGYVFYDPDYPLGKIYTVPIMPASMYELHITVKQPLNSFVSLVQEVTLPPEYNEAIIYNLACRLRPSYQLPADQQMVVLAETALNVIKNENAQVPLLRLPTALRRRSSKYNYFADQSF